VITVASGGSHPADVRRILDTIPEWFGFEASNAEYVEKASTLLNVVARDGDEVVGVCLVIRHNPLAAEIDLLAVPRDRHRHGIGRAIVEHLEPELRADGVRMLHVKTRGQSVPDEGYARTQAFYERMGFISLEERTDIWGPDNPCLFLAKAL
jgi:N-acetylglutamate synthase-like GNAT family acetyltransferase